MFSRSVDPFSMWASIYEVVALMAPDRVPLRVTQSGVVILKLVSSTLTSTKDVVAVAFPT
jgi:hypothetical protein